MASETLRALTRTYAAGELDRETYRLQRRRLLEDVAGGVQPVVAFKMPEPEAPTVFPYDDDDGDTTQEIIPGVEGAAAAGEAAERGQQRLFVILALALIVVGVIAWFFLSRTDDVPLPAPEPPVERATPIAAPVPPPRLFDDFLGANDWSTASLDALTRGWDDLGAEARGALADSTSMVRLTDALVQQVNSQSALIDLGQAEGPLEVQDELLRLAAHLGLDDARLGQARARWMADKAALAGDTGTTAPFEPEVPAAHAPASGELPPATEPPVTKTTAAPATTPAPEPVEAPAPKPEAAAALEPVAPQARSQSTTKPGPKPTPQSGPQSGPQAARPAQAHPPGTTPKTATAGASRTNCAAKLAQTRRPYCIDVPASGRKGPVLVVLPPGQFTMGGTRAEEQPRREVSIDYPLAIGMFEVSYAELDAFCAASGRDCPAQPWPEPDLPAVNVSRATAEAYTAWLTEITGAQYRLPSEAEWEYAARGGRDTPYPFGDGVLPTDARFSYSKQETRPLAANDRSLNRNDFRLFHIAGNVREMTRDGWREDYTAAPTDGSAVATTGGDVVARGGSYADAGDKLRSAARARVAAASGDRYTGLRVVRLLEE